MSLKDRIQKKAEESKILPHPLTYKNIDISVKTAYLGGVVLAALLDDAKIADEERKRIRELGLSLQLTDSDITETVGNVEALKSEDEQEAFLDEIIPVLKDREVALFFLCDMAKTFGADGQYTQNDLDYCNAIAEWIGLDAKDMTFYKEYRNYLLPGKEEDASQTILESQKNNLVLPDGLVLRFTPDLKPITLEPGTLPPGETRICNGKFRLDGQLHVGPGTSLILNGAEIEFGLQGIIMVDGAKLEISDCKFSASKEIPKVGKEFSLYLFQTKCAHLTFNRCSFSGNMVRGAIAHAGKLEFLNCRLSELQLQADPIVKCTKTLIMRQTTCVKLITASGAVISPGDASRVEECIFENCDALTGSIIGDLAAFNLYVSCNLFQKCHAGNALLFAKYNREFGNNRYENCTGSIGKDAVSREVYKAELEKRQEARKKAVC